MIEWGFAYTQNVSCHDPFFFQNKEISFKVSALLHAFAEQQPLVCLTKSEGGTIDHGTLLLVFQGVNVLDVAHTQGYGGCTVTLSNYAAEHRFFPSLSFILFYFCKIGPAVSFAWDMAKGHRFPAPCLRDSECGCSDAVRTVWLHCTLFSNV